MEGWPWEDGSKEIDDRDDLDGLKKGGEGMNDNMTTHVDKVKQGKEKGQGEKKRERERERCLPPQITSSILSFVYPCVNKKRPCQVFGYVHDFAHISLH